MMADVRAAMQRDIDRVGWHPHGSMIVRGLCPDDGCDLCNGLDAFWGPQLRAAATPAAHASIDVVAARRSRLAAARRLGLAAAPPIPVAAAPVAAPSPIAPVAPVAVQTMLSLDTGPATPLRTDDEIDDLDDLEGPDPFDPPLSSPMPAPAPVFALTHPTADSIRRNRRKR